MSTFPQISEIEQRLHLKRVRELLPKKYQDMASVCDYEGGYDMDIGDAETGDLMEIRIYQSSSRAPYFIKVKTQRRLHVRRKTKCFRMLKSGVFNYQKIGEHVNGLLKEHETIQAAYDKGHSIAMERIAAFKQFLADDPKMAALNLDIEAEPYNEDEAGDVEVEITSKEVDEADCHPVSSELTYNGDVFFGRIEVTNLTPEKLAAVLIVLRAEQFTVLDMMTLGEDSILGPIINKLTLSMSQAG